MGDFGIKISQPGFDVGTALDKNLIFTSRASSLKIVSEGSVSFSVGTTGGLLTVGSSIAHGLSFSPAFMAFARLGTGETRYYPHNIISVPTQTDYHHFWAYSDGTNINFVVGKNFQASNAGSVCTHNIHYFVFADPVA